MGKLWCERKGVFDPGEDDVDFAVAFCSDDEQRHQGDPRKRNPR